MNTLIVIIYANLQMEVGLGRKGQRCAISWQLQQLGLLEKKSRREYFEQSRGDVEVKIKIGHCSQFNNALTLAELTFNQPQKIGPAWRVLGPNQAMGPLSCSKCSSCRCFTTALQSSTKQLPIGRHIYCSICGAPKEAPKLHGPSQIHKNGPHKLLFP